MDEQLLDDLIRASAPPTGRTVSDESLRRVVEERMRAPRWRRRPLALISVVGALGLVGATAATAGPSIITHLGWAAEKSSVLVVTTGDVCEQGFRVVSGDSGRADSPDTALAREILVDLDIDSIDIEDDVAYLEKELASATWVGSNEPMTHTRSGIESWARYIAVNAEFRHAVILAGIDPDAVQLDAATECGQAQVE